MASPRGRGWGSVLYREREYYKKYVQGARKAGGRCRRSFCLCCGLFWFRRPKNWDPRDPRTRINGESTSMAPRRPGGPKILRHKVSV